MKKVFVGMSGGVDSSVSAFLLQKQGFEVTGVFMKNWTQDVEGMHCTWKEDLLDAKRVATKLNIPFKVFDFQQEYGEQVVDYMIDAFKRGETPNPDVMCNQEIKFKLFLDLAKKEGADYIATGHYAGVENGQLVAAKDKNKDQTYFLYRMPKSALHETLFPLKDLLKEQVREIARDEGIITATKKDSVGICFIGDVGLEDFLRKYADLSEGEIVDEDGRPVGVHKGAMLYTVGQRHGLGLTSGIPYYVSGKDIKKNEVYVTKDIHNTSLKVRSVELTETRVLSELPQDGHIKARFRHRGDLVSAKVYKKDAKMTVVFDQEQFAIAPGQSVVFYDPAEHICFGGGIVSKTAI